MEVLSWHIFANTVADKKESLKINQIQGGGVLQAQIVAQQ